MNLKYFRFSLFYGSGQASTGQWKEYNLAAVLRDCEAFAINGVAFTVEFAVRID